MTSQRGRIIDMYESFGAKVDQSVKTVTFYVFFPDNTLDPNQYQRGGCRESLR